MDKVSVPEGQAGKFRVERFIITEEEARFYDFRAAVNSHGLGYRGVSPGIFTRLTESGSVWMTDTPAEIRDHQEPVWKARGRCLINGLGLGVVLHGCLQKEEVEHVTVVEIEQDVIDLVAPHYLSMFGTKRLEVIHADAYEFKPPKSTRYNMVWNDIWIGITEDNYDGIKKLHRKYGRCSDWVGSWMLYEIKTRYLRERKEYKMWGYGAS